MGQVDQWRISATGDLHDITARADFLDARQLGNLYHRLMEGVYQAVEDPTDLAQLLEALPRVVKAGDQLYLDMDLSGANLPPGTRLEIGDAMVEITEPPHTGCRKFAERFGKDAVVFVNSGQGKKLNFRGINAKVVRSGDIRVGDVARKLPGG